MSSKLNKRRLKKKEKAVQHNQKNELRRQRETRVSKQREFERLEKEIGERREHLKEERSRRRQMRKKEEKEFRQMREREERTRKKEEEKEERMRKKADEDRLKKETQKWKKEIRDEEVRRRREERERRRETKKEHERKERFRIAKKKLESKFKKIGKRKPPFEVIKVGSNSNVKFTTYFDSYIIKINKYPNDPVNVFQKAIDMTINDRELVLTRTNPY